MPYRSIDWTSIILALITMMQACCIAIIAAYRGASHIKRARRQSRRSRKDAM
jgi:hypothetical protein